MIAEFQQVSWPRTILGVLVGITLIGVGLTGGRANPRPVVDVVKKIPTPKTSNPPTPEQRRQDELHAITAIKNLGGWVKTKAFQDGDHVYEVNMVYWNDPVTGQRSDNRNMSDQALIHMKEFPKLQSLLLHGGQANDENLKYLRNIKTLETLYIWNARKVTDQGIAHLKTLKNLQYLHVGKSNLTDESLKHLSTLPKLSGLALQSNQFTDKGLEYIKDMTRLKQLVLGLGRTQFTDAGLVHLKKLKRLRKLGLQHTQITNEGLKRLYELTELRDLWVSGTSVTQEGVDGLQRRIPNLKVSR